MPGRRSTRRNLGKKPEHLNDYSCGDSESDRDSESFHSNEDLDLTVMDDEGQNEQQNKNELLHQLLAQFEKLQTDVTQLKQQQYNVGAGTSTGSLTNVHPVTPKDSPQQHGAPLNADASSFTVSGQDCLVQEFRRPLHDLPTFDGSIEQWPKFHQTYIMTTATYKYTKLENLVRLEKALRGKAKESVEAMLIHPDSVDDAINRLKFLFGDTDSLIKSQISKIREMRSIPDYNLDQMINFSTKIENLKTFIISGGCEKYLTTHTTH